jgi:hypothetical protein
MDTGFIVSGTVGRQYIMMEGHGGTKAPSLMVARKQRETEEGARDSHIPQEYTLTVTYFLQLDPTAESFYCLPIILPNNESVTVLIH